MPDLDIVMVKGRAVQLTPYAAAMSLENFVHYISCREDSHDERGVIIKSLL